MRYPVEMDNRLSLQHQPYFFPLLAGLVAVLLAALAYSVVLGRAFDNPFFRYTAKVSFGLYIWHYLVILWVGRVARAGLPELRWRRGPVAPPRDRSIRA